MHKLWKKAAIGLSSQTEEWVVTGLGGWLLDTLRNNPDLTEFLLEED